MEEITVNLVCSIPKSIFPLENSDKGKDVKELDFIILATKVGDSFC